MMHFIILVAFCLLIPNAEVTNVFAQNLVLESDADHDASISFNGTMLHAESDVLYVDDEPLITAQALEVELSQLGLETLVTQVQNIDNVITVLDVPSSFAPPAMSSYDHLFAQMQSLAEKGGGFLHLINGYVDVYQDSTILDRNLTDNNVPPSGFGMLIMENSTFIVSEAANNNVKQKLYEDPIPTSTITLGGMAYWFIDQEKTVLNSAKVTELGFYSNSVNNHGTTRMMALFREVTTNTWQTVAYAEIPIPADAEADFYYAELTEPVGGFDVPATGNYYLATYTYATGTSGHPDLTSSSMYSSMSMATVPTLYNSGASSTPNGNLNSYGWVKPATGYRARAVDDVDGPSNMLLHGLVKKAAYVPSTAVLTLWVQFENGPVYNPGVFGVDLQGFVSRDGGATFFEVDLGQGPLLPESTSFISGNTTFSGALGQQMVYKVTTSNSLPLIVIGAALKWN